MRLLTLCAAFVCVLTVSAFGQNQSLKSEAEVGSPAPSFTATAISGNTFKLEDLKGKIVVLNFWSTKCVTCAYETPELNALVNAYKNNDVVFLAFAHDSQLNVQKFLKKKPFNYEIFPASLQAMIGPYGKPIGNGFNDIPFPMHIVINREGIIEVNEVGYEGVAAVRQKLAETFKTAAPATTK